MLQGKLDSHYHASHRQQFPQDVFSGTGCGLLQPLGICVCVCVCVFAHVCVCVIVDEVIGCGELMRC